MYIFYLKFELLNIFELIFLSENVNDASVRYLQRLTGGKQISFLSKSPFHIVNNALLLPADILLIVLLRYITYSLIT